MNQAMLPRSELNANGHHRRLLDTNQSHHLHSLGQDDDCFRHSNHPPLLLPLRRRRRRRRRCCCFRMNRETIHSSQYLWNM
jgi:hypothetical protein